MVIPAIPIKQLLPIVYLGGKKSLFVFSCKSGRSLDQSLTLRALEQGVQYAATAYTARLQAAGADISMAEVGAGRVVRLVVSPLIF